MGADSGGGMRCCGGCLLFCVHAYALFGRSAVLRGDLSCGVVRPGADEPRQSAQGAARCAGGSADRRTDRVRRAGSKGGLLWSYRQGIGCGCGGGSGRRRQRNAPVAELAGAPGGGPRLCGGQAGYSHCRHRLPGAGGRRFPRGSAWPNGWRITALRPNAS